MKTRGGGTERWRCRVSLGQVFSMSSRSLSYVIMSSQTLATIHQASRFDVNISNSAPHSTPYVSFVLTHGLIFLSCLPFAVFPFITIF